MNKERRKAIEDIVAQLEKQWTALEDVQNEEQDEYDNQPERIQCTERGENILENVDLLSQVSCNLNEVINDLQDIIDR